MRAAKKKLLLPKEPVSFLKGRRSAPILHEVPFFALDFAIAIA